MFFGKGEKKNLEKLGEIANRKIPNGNPKDGKYPKCHTNNFLAPLGKKKNSRFCTGVS